jgi:hypothetical protein
VDCLLSIMLQYHENALNGSTPKRKSLGCTNQRKRTSNRKIYDGRVRKPATLEKLAALVETDS